MFAIYTKNIRFFYKEAKVKPHDVLYINAKHAIVSDEGCYVRLFDERGEQIFAGALQSSMSSRTSSDLGYYVKKALNDDVVYFTDISAEEV